MENIFSLGFWFNARPGDADPLFMMSLAAFIIFLFILAFVSGMIKSRQKGLYFKIYRSFNSFGWTNLIIGLFLLFFIYEKIYFLSMRLWLAVWLASMLAWIFFIVKSALKIPEIRKKIEEEKEFKKYIP